MKEKAQGRYDFLIVGAGMYGAAAARGLSDRGWRVLVVEKRAHVGGNAYTEWIDGICVHMYGAHIFHTDSERVWQFVNRFARFNDFINEPVANYHGEVYSLPFNMNTFREMWGVTEPEEARRIISKQIRDAGFTPGEKANEPSNLEEHAVRTVGTDVYEKLIRGYTEKQWGRPCSSLPASILLRIPVRYDYNNNYFDDRYQGIPVDGFTAMTERMLDGIDVMTDTDFLDPENRICLESAADKVIFTGQIDAYYDYRFGPLEYRGLRFETLKVETEGGFYQSRAVVNYTDRETPWTRIIEHRHFYDETCIIGCRPGLPEATIITREYPAEWSIGDEAYYPVNDAFNNEKYQKYLSLAEGDDKLIFGGRLGSYRYYDMDDAIEAALIMADKYSNDKNDRQT